jgi:hypothetical protein
VWSLHLEINETSVLPVENACGKRSGFSRRNDDPAMTNSVVPFQGRPVWGPNWIRRFEQNASLPDATRSALWFDSATGPALVSDRRFDRR